jgi:indolepyruvate ferredoxin oxidoreductase beta subunit
MMNIVLAAVGGQGCLFAARVIGKVAQNNGLEVKASEVHGMSQRGGSVITFVRYGTSIASPIVEEGFADVVMAFEELEGARTVNYLRPSGTIILNTQRINPLPVLSGGCRYPAEIPSLLAATGVTVRTIDALAAARESGSVKAVNSVMLGQFAVMSGFDKHHWLEALGEVSPVKFAAVNTAAFEKGYSALPAGRSN